MYSQAIKVNYPNAIEKEYKIALLRLVKDIYLIIIKEIVNIEPEYDQTIRKDAFNDDFQGIIKLCELKISFELKKFFTKIIQTATKTNKFNQIAVRKSLVNTAKKSLSIGTTTKIEDAMSMFVSDNVRLIKSINQDLLGKVEEVVYSGIRRGVSFKDLSNELVKSFTITKKRANIIARDQINKLHGDLTRLRHKELGIVEYKWLTSLDSRVRPSHEVLNGRICSYDDVTLYKDDVDNKVWSNRSNIGGALYHPAQEVLCRCTMLAVIKN